MELKSYRDGFSNRTLRGLLLAVCVVQAGAIVGMVRERAAILASGTVIEMDVAPVDPRSLFRGDYVALAYPAARFNTGDATGAAALALAGASPVYATLVKNDAGEWRPVAVSAKRPAAREGEAVLRARTDRARRFSQEIGLRYGVETYFVPEGSGKAIEDAARAKDVRVRVAVGADGQTAIKAVIVGGKVIEEPAF